MLEIEILVKLKGTFLENTLSRFLAESFRRRIISCTSMKLQPEVRLD